MWTNPTTQLKNDGFCNDVSSFPLRTHTLISETEQDWTQEKGTTMESQVSPDKARNDSCLDVWEATANQDWQLNQLFNSA